MHSWGAGSDTRLQASVLCSSDDRLGSSLIPSTHFKEHVVPNYAKETDHKSKWPVRRGQLSVMINKTLIFCVDCLKIKGNNTN